MMQAKKSDPAAALVLFDIDGTLLRRAGHHHRIALIEAIRDVTRFETTTDSIPLHGMLDPGILAKMMENAGAPAALIRRSMPEILTRAQTVYQQGGPSLERKVCLGVRPLLRRLQRAGIPLGLVTGNLTKIAWMKLERAGLNSYFAFGAFGEMSKTRGGLARLAVRDARERGWVRKGTPISLIGDTPSDVKAARENRLRSVAVCTGISSPEELAASAPDILVRDLRELRVEMLL